MITIDDEKIIELYWERSEEAIRETENKYGRYLLSVCSGILQDDEDRIECVNDALLAAWNAIPPARPPELKLFLARIVRNMAISKWRSQTAEKRGGGQAAAVFSELAEISDGRDHAEEITDNIVISELLSKFLRSLGKTERLVFIRRYWLFMSTAEIAKSVSLSENSVRVMLHRTRKALRKLLVREGFEI